MNHLLRFLSLALQQTRRPPRALRPFVSGFTVLIERTGLTPGLGFSARRARS
jgi:hypothetical protein